VPPSIERSRRADPLQFPESANVTALPGVGRNGPAIRFADVVPVTGAGAAAVIVTGIGVSALTPATLVPGMRVGTATEGFPPLAPLRIGMFYKHARLSKAGHGLAQWLMQQITLAGQGTKA